MSSGTLRLLISPFAVDPWLLTRGGANKNFGARGAKALVEDMIIRPTNMRRLIRIPFGRLAGA